MQLASKSHVLISDLNADRKINADRERIGQVLNNLISNAVKYSPGAEKVIVTSWVHEEKITVSVQDFGAGVSSIMQKKIFERFFRLPDESIKSYPGLELGLYIASEIIKRHRGTIGVKSQKNKGSVFWFTIPIN